MTSNVIPLGRSPIRQATVVNSDVAHTFDAFVRTIGQWWPVRAFSKGTDRVRDVTFERQAGGRVFESWDDGTEVDWGEVRVWEPPKRFSLTWRLTPVTTEVELTFKALGRALTRVAVEHRGWEALSDEQVHEACALPGGYVAGAFDQGWATILSSLANAVAEAAALEACARINAVMLQHSTPDSAKLAINRQPVGRLAS
jgi:Activator of Hsp90 ATPase homolog 1-like protein